MAKTVSSSLAVRNAPQPKAHRYIDALFGDDFGRMSKLTIHSANGFARKKLDTASQTLQVRSEAREKRARLAEARENRAAERGLQAEQREADRRTRRLFRPLKTQFQPDRVIRHKPPKARPRLWPYAATALPKYDGPILDRRGHRGVFARFRYYSRRTAEKGVSQRVVKYVFHGAEVDRYGVPYQFSNIGRTIDETLCAFDHLEQINWSAAKNAKLMMHGILAVDYRQTPDEMMRCGIRWAEECLGDFDLPYLVTLHAPPPDGDQRNWHLHVLWSFRPLVRTGDFEWEVGEMLRTDLDNPQAMKLMREIFAGVMTQMSFEAGQRQIYTAKSNADRGLPHEPQVHLGGIRTSLARDGKYVAANEDNHERVLRSKAAVLDDDLRHADEDRAKQQTAARTLAARWMRSTIMAASVPMRAVAPALFNQAIASVAKPLKPAEPIIVREVALPPARIARAPMLSLPAEVGTKPAAIMAILPRTDLPALAPPAARPARVNFRNFGIRALPVLRQVADAPVRTPLPRAMVMAPRLFADAHPALPFAPPAGIVPVATLPRRSSVAAVVRVPAFSARATPRSAVSIDMKPVPILQKSGNITGLLPTVEILAARPSPIPIITAEASGPLPQVGKMTVPPMADPMAVIEDGGAIDRAIARLEAARRREEERRKRVLQAEFLARETERTVNERRRAVEHLLLTIAEERHYVARDDRGYKADSALLTQSGLSREDLFGDDVQKRLEKLAAQQANEFSRIGTYVAGKPGHLFYRHGAWQLDDAAPRQMQELVAAWANDDTARRILERLAKGASASPPATTEPVDEERRRQLPGRPIPADRAANRRATLALVAEQREASTTRWLATRRTDAPPGAKEPAAERTAPPRTGVTRHAPGQTAGNDGQDR